MRQGQHSHNHNKRSRGRGRGGRPGGGGGGGGGGGNPINRVYESNGPDVKVRGTAQTIAEKYMQLARDAHSSGDTVMAESYNQHAEHYLRILAAAQAYNQQHMAQQQFRRPMGGEELSDNFEDAGEAESETASDSEAQAAPVTPESTPSAPSHQAHDNEQRQAGRRPEDRPRQQFDRMRNGGDQPRQSRIEDEADGWDGPQPQFLRRPSGPHGQANGGDRQQSDRQQRDRRPMRERGVRPRDEQSTEATDTAPSSDADGPTAS